jgi:hypothetical protein
MCGARDLSRSSARLPQTFQTNLKKRFTYNWRIEELSSLVETANGLI